MDVRQFLERAFPDHSIGEKLREDAEGVLFRGRRIGDGRAILSSSLPSRSIPLRNGSVEKLMGLVMDHAGADRGLLILPAGESFVVEAEAVLDRRGLAIQQLRAPLSPGQVADGVFRYVLRTRELVILEDASSQGLFTEDPYVKERQSKSILGLPLLKQARLLGVLYLENSLAPGVFTPSRIAALEVLASQAAISLENARLFAELDQEKSRLQASEERFSKAFKSNPTPRHPQQGLDLRGRQ